MRLDITRLGRIAEASLDLRPLTVFVGANNTNKTWTAFAAYRAMSLLSGRAKRRTGSEAWWAPGALDLLLAAIRSPGDGPGSSRRWLLPRTQALARGDRVVRVDEAMIAEAIGAPVERGTVTLTLTSDEVDRMGLYREADIEVRAGHQDVAVTAYLRGATWSGEEFSSKRREQWTLEDLQERLFPLVGAVFGDVVALPLERTDFRSLATVLADPQRRGTVVSDLAAFALGARAVTQASHPLRAPIVDLMGMTPSWDEDLHFVLRDGSRLPYAAASSMVRALLGLDLFVASAPGERDVLVIDEPELSAHPKAQLAIIEILATCVQRGDRVLLTTHSPYLVDHLANLLAASRLPEGARRQVADRFALRDPRAFVDPEQVAVYEFVEAGDRIEVVDRLDRERGSLDLDTFAEQTDRLSAVYGAVLDLEVPKARAVR